MSSNTDTSIEYHELDLTKSDDLEVFLESVEDVYADSLEYEAVAKSEGYKSLTVEDVSGSEIFETLNQKLAEIQELVSKCRNEIIPNNKEIEDSLVENMQQLYDDMITLRNHIREIYENYEDKLDSNNQNEVREITQFVPVAKVIEQTYNPTIVENKTENEDATNFQISNKSESTKAEVPVAIAQKTIDKSFFSPSEQSLKLVEDQVAAIKKKSLSLFSQTEITDDISIQLGEFDICEKRIRYLFDRIDSIKESREDESVLINNLKRYERVAEEIEKNAHSIEAVLMKKRQNLDSPNVTNESSTQKSAPHTVSEIGAVNIITSVDKTIPKPPPALVPDQEAEEVVKSDKFFICGMMLPEAGPAGLPAARALREALMMARDRHPYLIQHPEKQVIIDKLIRKLGVIPSSGFDEKTDIAEITQLARAANILAEVSEKVDQTQPVSQVVTEDEVNEDKDEDVLVIPAEMKRKNMDITSDKQEEGDIVIRVDKKTRQKYEVKPEAETVSKESQDVPTKDEPAPQPKVVSEEPLVVAKDDMENRAPIIAELEKVDPINQAVPGKVPSIVHPKLIHEETSLSRKYLNNGRYLTFIRENYTSPAAFERMLDTAVTQIEAKTVDAIERFFGDTFASPFAFMQEMSVAEVYDLSMKPDVRQELSARDIKYETFVAWIDMIDEMQEVVGQDQDMEFGELFSRWIIETEIAYYEVEAAVA